MILDLKIQGLGDFRLKDYFMNLINFQTL